MAKRLSVYATLALGVESVDHLGSIFDTTKCSRIKHVNGSARRCYLSLAKSSITAVRIRPGRGRNKNVRFGLFFATLIKLSLIWVFISFLI